MAHSVIARVPCEQCNTAVSVGYDTTSRSVSFAHDPPHCHHAFCLLGSWDDEECGPAHLAAVAELIIGWDVMAFVIAEPDAEGL